MNVGKLSLFVCLCALVLPAVSMGEIAISQNISSNINHSVLLVSATGSSSATPSSSSTQASRSTPAAAVLSSAPTTGGKVFADLQSKGGWTGYALLPPGWGICSGCGPNGSRVRWTWAPHMASPSMDGKSTKTSYNGGSTQWADILWNNHLIGDFSSQGLTDTGKTLVPALHNFTYDVYFWIGNTSNSQGLEFDINQFFGGKSYIWGHECRIMGGHEWDTWSNPGGHWVPSGIPCNPKSNAWNHLTIKVQRTSNGHLLFKSITLNGLTGTLNRYDTPTNKAGWYGVTVNYQMDSNVKKTPYPVYLDRLTFTAQ
jgi:hypothetical protein